MKQFMLFILAVCSGEQKRWVGIVEGWMIGSGIGNRQEGSPESTTGGGGFCSRGRLLYLTIHRLDSTGGDVCH